jgi:hypothetical protein
MYSAYKRCGAVIRIQRHKQGIWRNFLTQLFYFYFSNALALMRTAKYFSVYNFSSQDNVEEKVDTVEVPPHSCIESTG